ncbi:hypothetical protein MHY13_03300 [Corynebacterium sp. ACRPE]|uniref:hypothetical protein n=1 Tax=Corynebacterium sp. ACRPE TaxID=2918196 RepID=UPI001EF73204|nr:hypothetical protein [Corynebacterium sp. ACRPE]MCG7467159.1 hypothetical protein [Corynebacterium sp. ACRPE]
MANYSRAELMKAAQRIDVSVKEMPLGRAIAQAQKHYNHRNPDGKHADLNSSNEFLARITVNYLRHICSHYDSARDFLRSITDERTRRDAGAIIKIRLLADVARKYPPLEHEARRQAAWEEQKTKKQ